ncbi:MAG TPA: tetratricopeptide repeat protein [Nitrospira sp.]|nr:tetratricopeptide repeat protein [Nitrospira sp.]
MSITRSVRFRSFTRRFLFIGLLGSLFASSTHAQIGKPEGLYYKSWGVVIAVENYLLAPKVPGAREDGKAVAQALRTLGFDDVVELYDNDASFRRLQQTLSDLLPRKVGRQDRLVIYFVGHAGVTSDQSGKDMGYLVPYDAQIGNVAKSITFEQLKEFTRRTASKHTLLLFDVPVRGWEVTAAQQLSLEGRVAPEDDLEKRAVQVLTAGDKGEAVKRSDNRSLYVQVLVKGLSGEADLDKNGWLLGTELGRYVQEQVEAQSQDAQHPLFAQLEGDGDTILIEGRKASFRLGAEPQSPLERQQAAKMQYEQAFTILQSGKAPEEALERLNKALEYDPAFGDAYVLKSYVRLEVLPNLDEALSAAKLAVQHAPKNPDSQYTLGLVYEKQGRYDEAERAMRDALVVNPNYSDVYFSLGVMYADEMKDQQKAVDAFQRYLELGGTHTRAREAVARSNQAGPGTR